VLGSAALGLQQCPWVASILVQALVDQPSDHVAELKALGAHLWQLAAITGALLGVVASCHALPTLLPAVLLDVVPRQHLFVAQLPLTRQVATARARSINACYNTPVVTVSSDSSTMKMGSKSLQACQGGDLTISCRLVQPWAGLNGGGGGIFVA